MGRASRDLRSVVRALYFDCGGNYTGVHVHQNSLDGQCLQNIRAVSQKLNIEFPCDLAIPLVVTYPPKGLKTGTQANICTPLFIAESLTVAEIPNAHPQVNR